MNRRIVALAAGCVTLAACHLPSPSDQNWVLGSYDIPADEVLGLESNLRDLFKVSSKNDKGDETYRQIGRSSIAPDGRLVVVGSKELQAGVANLVKTMAEHPSAATRTPTVESTFWLVTGKPAKETIVPPELSAVGDALRTLAQQTGPQEFATWEVLRLRASGDASEATVSGRHASVKAWTRANAAEKEVLLGSDIMANRLSEHMLGQNFIKTKIRIAPDQTVVLAQTGFNPSEPLGAASGNEPPVSLYYLVRATIPHGDGR